MTKSLTEKQEKFLDVLYEEAEGDIRTAMRLAGYSDETRIQEVVGPLAKEIRELTRNYIDNGTIKAAQQLVYMVTNSHEPGIKDRLAVVKELLDRGGFDKTQRIEIEAPNAVFVLPSKKEDDAD